MRSLLVLVQAFLVLLSVPLHADSYTFRHYAGTRGGPGRTDGIAAEARFWSPSAVATDASGNVYVADTENHTIRRVTSSGVVTTVAGVAGQSGFANGFGAAARFKRPGGIAVDASGNVYVADENHVVRKIAAGGLVTTFAGNAAISGHTDGTGTAARFFLIFGMAFDSAGNLYVAEYGTHTIRKITPAAVVTTIAGTPDVSGSANGTGSAALFNRPNSLAVDATSNVYVTEFASHTIRKITPAAVVTTVAGSTGVCGYADGVGTSAVFCAPRGIAVDSAGDLYVADGSNFRIRKVLAASGTVSTFAGSGSLASIDGAGTSAAFMGVQSVASDASNNLYVPEGNGHTIRKITPAAVVTTLAGVAPAYGFSAAAGQNARFYNPEGVVVDGDNNVYIADTSNSVIRKIPNGTLEPIAFAGSPGTFGTADGTGAAASFRQPSGMTTDTSNNVYVADRNAHTIRKITTAAVVTTIAGSPLLSGSDDGNGSAARFNGPQGIAADSSGNLYVADTDNHTIRKLTPAGDVTTLAGMAGFNGSTNGTGSAARFNAPAALVVGSDGNLYVADRDNHTIRKVTMAGEVTTLAGQPGTLGSTDGTGSSARLAFPRSIAADGSGNLYVGDYYYTIRKVTLAGEVTTIGGKYELKGSEDGTGDVARFSDLKGIASTSGGVLFVADAHTLRRGAAALPDVATIDIGQGAVGVVRQLSTAPATANLWFWSIVRRPPGSVATLSTTNTRTPTFTPDVPDLYTFRLFSALGSPNSVTEVSLRAVSETLTVGPGTLPDGLLSINYSATLTASGGTPPYFFELVGGVVPPGISVSGTGEVSGVPTIAMTGDFTVRATDSVGSTGQAEVFLTIVATAPAAEAHAVSSTSVAVTWPVVSSATGYRVYRSPGGGGFSTVGDAATSTFTDTTAATNMAYLYRITALDAANHESTPGNTDLATTVIFTDSPLNAGVTPVRAVHVSQLRTAVNAVRTLALIGTTTFTDPSLSGVAIKAVHITELRSALAAARSALSLPVTAGPALTPGVTRIQATHVEELRDGVE